MMKNTTVCCSERYLNRWNVECHEVVNGMEALEILKEDRFDILFMDMRMPGIDGLRTTQFIRNEMKISEPGYADDIHFGCPA